MRGRVVEASKQLRRVNGHTHLPVLRAALKAATTGRAAATDVPPVVRDEEVRAA